MKISKETLISEKDRLQKENTILHIGVNDLYNGKVKWFKKGKHKVGVSRVTGPCGGIVFYGYRQDDGEYYICVYQFEDWFPKMRDYVPAHTNQDGLDLRNVALEVHQWVVNQRIDAEKD